MRAVFNPIALARLLTGDAPGEGTWAAIDKIVAGAFGTANADEALYGTSSTRGILELLDDVARATSRPATLSKILALPAARTLAKTCGGESMLARLLPFVVPVSGAAFDGDDAPGMPASVPGSPGAPPGVQYAAVVHPQIGAYRKIGALATDGISWLDPEQGSTSDCYLISAMIAIAWSRPQRWRARLAEAVQGSKATDVLHVGFHGKTARSADLPPFDVPARVPLDPHGHLIYAHSATTNETWPALLERAFVMQATRGTDREPTVDDYRKASNWCDPQVAARMLIGGLPKCEVAVPYATQPLSAKFMPLMPQNVTRFPTMAWTWPRSHSLPGPKWREAGLLWDHAYALLGHMHATGGDYVVLRNPFGTNQDRPHFPGGMWPEGNAANGGTPVELGRHGVFACPTAIFDRFFHRAGWVDLPADGAA